MPRGAICAEDALRCLGIPQVFYSPLAVPTIEAIYTKSLIPYQDCRMLDLVATVVTVGNAGRAYIAVIHQQGVIIRIHVSLASFALKLFDIPSTPAKPKCFLCILNLTADHT